MRMAPLMAEQERGKTAKRERISLSTPTVAGGESVI